MISISFEKWGSPVLLFLSIKNRWFPIEDFIKVNIQSSKNSVNFLQAHLKNILSVMILKHF